MNCILVFLRSRIRLIESYLGKSGNSLLRRMLTLVVCLGVLSQSAQASFEPLAVGARPSGMGEAFTAVADDVYSLYYNPAGLMQLSRPELGAYYSRLFAGLSDNSEIAHSFVGYGQPVGKGGRWGSLGLDYMSLSLTGLYKEETFGLGYAYSLKERWNIGGSVKLLKKTIGTDDYSNNAVNPITGAATGQADPLFASGRSKSAAALDLGMQCKLTSYYALGVAIRNLNSPNMALGNDTDPAPSYYGVGIARKTRESSLSVEAGEYKSTQSNFRFALGGERWLDAIGLRAGLAVGSRNYSVGSFGASYKFSGLQLDYAMNYPFQGIKGTLGNQQISMTVRFGKPPKDAMAEELLAERQKRLEAEMHALEAQQERDRLKSEIMKLTQLPAAPAKPVEEAPKPVTGLEKVLLAAQQELQKDVARSQEQKQLLQEFTEAIEGYIKMRRGDATLVERLDVVQGIQKMFRGKGLDMTAVEQEVNALGGEVRKAKSDYDLSLSFYETLVRRGASLQDRQRMLNRILLKYKPVGLDVSTVEKERMLLERQSH